RLPPARRSPRSAPRRRAASSSGARQPPRLPDDQLVHLVLPEPGLEQVVGPEREPVLDGRVVRIAEVAGEEVVPGGRADAVEDVVERRLAAVRRAQAALEQAAFVRERDLLLDREVLRRKLRVRDDDRPHALLERAVDDGEDVLAAEVARREDQPVAGDRPQDGAGFREQLAVLAAHDHRLDREAEAAQLVLELRPERYLVARLRL